MISGSGAQKVFVNGSGIDIITPVITFFGGMLVHFFGTVDESFYALLTFLAIDHLFGQAAARVTGTHSVKVVKLDLMRKGLIIMLVGIANTIDTMLFNKSMLRTAIIFFYIGNQGLSILIHSTTLGLPFPKKLREILEQFRDKGDSGNATSIEDSTTGKEKIEASIKNSNEDKSNDEPKRLDRMVRTARGKS